jgi:hypothetical protein
MLHEILLSLSGQPSPLFEQPTAESGDAKEGFPLLSAPEKVLLQPLGRLSKLHRELRAYTRVVSSSHPSMICRAVSTTISVKLLGNFQKKILEVEKAILETDASYVGGYGIVPLSTIVGEFNPWVRRMEWLWNVVRLMYPEREPRDARNSVKPCTGKTLIDYLRKESQTGYVDLEEMAIGLIKAGETAWMRQLSMWILYGQLPSRGALDFFIQESPAKTADKKSDNTKELTICADLLPSFVPSSTASSIFFIGRSLNHIRAQGTVSAGEEPCYSASQMTLHGDYIRHLSSLSSPISAIGLSRAVAEIRVSLSQTVLSRLLPLPKIIEVLSVLHDFLLLCHGEFPMALVSYAEKRMRSKSEELNTAKSTNPLDQLTIKQGDAAVVLAQAWAELYSLQNEEDPFDDGLDVARELVHLSVTKTEPKQVRSDGIADTNTLAGISNVPFDDLLFSTPTSLSLRLRPPLDLFLTQTDMETYSKMHAYLLGIRRAQIRLSELWKLTPLRRTHPAPWGPPLSNMRGGKERLQSAREREKRRAMAMRGVWASGSAVLFVLSELGSYLQGEVISGSWSHFKQWLEGGRARPASETSASTDKNQETCQHDPETITVAHRSYLVSISHALFLTDVPFTHTLRDLLTKVDHFIALITHLQTVQVHLDLETDQGVIDSLANHAEDEKKVWVNLQIARSDLDKGISELFTRLRDIDDLRVDVGANRGGEAAASVPGADNARMNEYIPWKPAGVDRLLMSLDFGVADTGSEGTAA